MMSLKWNALVFTFTLIPMLGLEAAPLDLTFGGVYNGPEAQSYWNERFGSNFFKRLAAFQTGSVATFDQAAPTRAPSTQKSESQRVNFGPNVAVVEKNVVANDNNGVLSNNNVVAIKTRVDGVNVLNLVPVYRPTLSNPLFPRVNHVAVSNLGSKNNVGNVVVDNFVVHNNENVEEESDNAVEEDPDDDKSNVDVEDNNTADLEVKLMNEEAIKTRKEDNVDQVIVDDFVVGKKTEQASLSFQLDDFETLVEEFQIASNRV